VNVLEEAIKLTTQDRQSVYGHPYSDFGKVAAMTKPITDSRIDPRLKHALYMIQVKIARLLNTPNHKDSIIDIAGYVNTYAMVLEVIEQAEKAELTETSGPIVSRPDRWT